MTKPVKKSQVLNDGLRYKAKASASAFAQANQFGQAATMSCFLCGKHRPRTQLMTRKLLGKAQNICAPKFEK